MDFEREIYCDVWSNFILIWYSDIEKKKISKYKQDSKMLQSLFMQCKLAHTHTHTHTQMNVSDNNLAAIELRSQP